MRKILSVVIMGMVAASLAYAELPSVFGDALEVIELDQFFAPDPFEYDMVAGGGTYFDAEADLSDYFRRDGEIDVAGWVFGSGPDIRLFYNADGASRLSFEFVADGFDDTFLLINDPDGDWWVFDDSESTLDPFVRILNPPGGQYDIWVGTWNEETVPGTFYISEL